MPKIHTIGSIDIVIYFNEHGATIAGGLPGRELRRVRRWVLANQALLKNKWNEIALGM